MADTKISALTAQTGANSAAGDLIPVVDVSDTTMAASGTTKKITLTELMLGLTLAGWDIPVVASPAAPASSFIRLFARDLGRPMPAFVSPDGASTTLQPHTGRNKVRGWNGGFGITTPNLVNTSAPTATGTATAATRATTKLHQFMERIDYLVTAAATNAVAGFRATNSNIMPVHFGNVAKVGGFHFICRWGPATGVATTTNRAFVGLANSTAAPTDVEPSSQTVIVGMGWDAADANVQFMTNDATGTATKTATGIAVPTADRTAVYELDMYVPANSTTLTWRITDLVNGTESTGTVTTDLPAVNTVLTPRGYMSVGGTSSVIGIALMSLYIETDF